jgi:ADP-heptose:LPS heptosyltransferase
MSKPRMLVLRGGAIGDFIVTLPALAALRERWPGAYIELAGYPHIAALALEAGLADHVVSLERAEMARFFSLSPGIPPEQAAHVRSFDLIISYLYDPDGTVRRNMLGVGARQVICSSPIVEGTHAVDHLMKPLEQLAIYASGGESPQLVLGQGHRERGRMRIRAAGERVVAIHPGSGSPGKNWPLDGFAALAGRLTDETPVSPIFILGEADSEIETALTARGSEVPVLSGCTLVELAESLSACEGYVGNDSGVTHIAASLGIPVVALYGPTDPDVWGPRGPNVRILQAEGPTTQSLERISTGRVFEAAVSVCGL